jgi:hypothetical protein
MDGTRELAQEAWAEYLDAVSRELPGARVSIEVVTPPNQLMVQARHLALQALAYDHRGDVFEVAAAQRGPQMPNMLRRMVDHPERIVVDSWTLLAPMTIQVDGQDGISTVVRIEQEPDLAD